MQGPARSPIALLSPRADSAKALAHWLIACSELPAQNIRRSSTQKIFCPKSPRRPIPPSPSSSGEYIGTRRKKKRLKTGRAAQITANTCQWPVPNSAKNPLEISTTPRCPQQ